MLSSATNISAIDGEDPVLISGEIGILYWLSFPTRVLSAATDMLGSIVALTVFKHRMMFFLGGAHFTGNKQFSQRGIIIFRPGKFI